MRLDRSPCKKKDPFPEHCPSTHPVPFDAGKRCCNGNTEEGTGLGLSLHSRSCRGNSIPCPLELGRLCSERRKFYYSLKYSVNKTKKVFP